MTTRSTAATRRDAKSVEATLLARLGLPGGASSQDVEEAHDGLVEFLESAPAENRAWARQQIGLIDEAYALLSDPTIDRSALAATVAVEAAPAPKPQVSAAAVEVQPVQRPAASPMNPRVKRLMLGGAAIVGVVAIAAAGFNLNGGTGVPPINGSPAPEAQASAAVDAAQVATLMQKIQTDPKDVASLQSLADLYYQAGDYKASGTFLEKVLALDPKNVTGLLALGAVEFNLGDATAAEEDWRAALAVDPKSVEAHYDLGFMYLSKSPPDMANVKLEWGKVVELDPTSNLAKTVSTHLASLDASPAPGGSGAPSSAAPAPSGSPAPAGTAPAASPAASPAPSGK